MEPQTNRPTLDQPDQTPPRSRYRRSIPPILIGIAGVVIGLMLFNFARERERRRAVERFEDAAQQHINALRSHVETHARSLKALEALFLSSGDVGDYEFLTFSNVLAGHEPDCVGLGWAQRVWDRERVTYEAAFRHEGYQQFQIHQWADGGGTTPADRRADYYPVDLFQSHRLGLIQIGLDLASTEVWRSTLTVARDTGEMTASKILSVPWGNQTHSVALVALPIYDRQVASDTVDDRRSSLKGFVFETRCIDHLIPHSFRTLPATGVDVAVIDRTDPTEHHLLGVYQSRLGSSPQEAPTLDGVLGWDPGLLRTANLDVAGRNWEIICRPIPGWMSQAITWQPWLILGAVWLLTGVLGAYIHTLVSHGARFETLAGGLKQAYGQLEVRVEERTAQLSQANKALREEVAQRRQAEETIRHAKEQWEQTFDSVPDPIAVLDSEHQIVRVNQAMADRLGVRPAECVGKTCYRLVHNADQPPEDCPHMLALHDGREHHAEVYEPNLGGHFLVSASPISNAEGQIVGGVHVARDITDRKRAEQQLAAAHRRLMMADEQERRAIAAELHDSVGQQMIAMQFSLEAALAKARDEGAAPTEDLEDISAFCRETTNEIRAVCHGLFPPTLEALGLCPALNQLSKEAKGSLQVRTTCQEDVHNFRMPADVEIALFRIAQESVTNALRHSKGTTITLGLSKDSDREEVTLTITDDGEGFDTSQAGASGLGLRTMQERANAIGGTLEIASHSRGTRVTATAFYGNGFPDTQRVISPRPAPGS